MSSIFACNLRGFNKTRKLYVVKEWIRSTKPVFCCLVETKVQKDKFKTIFDSTFPWWKAFTNYEHHRLGRIWVIWESSVDVHLVYKSAQMITCWVTLVSGQQFLCTSIYISNFQDDRRVLWTEQLSLIILRRRLS